MLPPFNHDATSPQSWQERDDRRPYDGDPSRTLVAASRNQQHFVRSAYLSLAQPCFGAKARVRGGRQRLAKIQNVLCPELGLVESFPDGMEGYLTGSHSEVYDRPPFPVVSRMSCASSLLALRRCASSQSERGCNRYSPALWRLYEDPFGDTAGGRVLLCHGVAVRAVHDAGSDWQNSQIPGDKSIRPSRVAARAPIVVSELQSRRSVARKRTAVKIRGEVSSAVALMNRVYVLFEQASRLDRVGCRGSGWRRIDMGWHRCAPHCNQGYQPGRRDFRPCHTSLRKMVPQS
jgi:hypothetical protein